MRTPRLLLLAPVAALLLAALLLAANARPQPRIQHQVQLEYIRGKGAEDCPGEGMVRRAILSRLNEDPFSQTAKAKLRMTIERVGAEFQASYELIDDDGRPVKGPPLPKHPACVNAAHSLGLSVATFMPPFLTASIPGPAASASASVSAKPAASASASVKPAASASAKPAVSASTHQRPPLPPLARPIVPRFDGGVVMSIGAAPTTSVGLLAHLGASWWFLSLSAGVRLEVSPSDGTAPVRISTTRVLAEVVPCFHLDRGLAIAFGCGVAQAGGLSVTGKAADLDSTRNTTVVSVGGRLGLQIPHVPFFPRGLDPFVSFDMLGAVRRTNIFTLTGVRLEWRAHPVTWGFAVGVAL